MSTVIKVENLSKQYRLGQVGTGTLSHDLNRWWHRVRGKEDPYLKIGETNDRSTKGNSELVWALKDINFEVRQGEVLGIIGKNGAGKSTLLKILSKVTGPTTGSIKAKGRIASLLEVGTGFHPELTGRENIYLNGAILGMTKREVKAKLDEIVDFAGVARYLDTPVKRYSSGMMVRLGFAVAAHLEPEILIVDEVLAVGDAEFQRKAVGKMQEVSKGGGRTVLFVSHNMGSVKQLCTKGIVLVNGQTLFEGAIQNAVDFYLVSNQKQNLGGVFRKDILEGKDVELKSAEVLNEKLDRTNEFDLKDKIVIQVNIYCKKPVPGIYGYVAIRNSRDELLIESDTYDYIPNCLEYLKLGNNSFYIIIKPNILPIGDYRVYFSFASSFASNYLVDVPGDILKLSIVDHSTQRGARRTAKTGYLLKWKATHAK